MSARIVQRLYKLPRISSITRRCEYATKWQSYATATTGAVLPQLQKMRPVIMLQSPMRQFATLKTATKEDPSSAEEVLTRLESWFKLNGYVHYEQFRKLLELLEAHPNPQLPADQALFLLGACGPLMPANTIDQRQQMFDRMWSYLARCDQLGEAHYHTRLNVLQHNRASLPDHSGFLREMDVQLGGTTRTPQLYAELLSVACGSGDMQQATAVLAEMRECNYALTAENFESLIIGHARNNDLHGSQLVLESMSAAGVPIGSSTRTAQFIALAENRDEAKAADILSDYHGQFTAVQVLQMLRSTIVAPLRANLIEQLVRELPADFLSDCAEVPIQLRNLCIELLHNSNFSAVVTIIGALPKPTFQDNQSVDTFGVFLLQELTRAQVDSEKLLEICRMLKNTEKNSRALHIAVEVALRRSPPAGLPLLEALAKDEPLRPHYFWPLMMYNRRRHGETGILRTLKHMSELNVECDLPTLLRFVLPHSWTTLEDPLLAMKKFDEVGVRPALSLQPVILHTLAQQRLDEVVQLAQLYPTKLDLNQFLAPLNKLAVTARATKRYQQFVQILAALSKKASDPKHDFLGQLLLQMVAPQARLRADLSAFKRFLGEMHKHELKLSAAAAGSLEAALRNDNNAGDDFDWIAQTLQKMTKRNLALRNESAEGGAASPSFIQHPRDMTREDLECHLIELEAKGLNARGVLRRLLQLSVRDNQLTRALEIKAKCDQLHVQLSPGMLASIFDMYIKLRDLPNAEKSLKLLHETYPGFLIDEHKIIDYAALLVQTGDLEAGKVVLSERAASHRIIGGDYVLKNVWNFLTSVAQLAAAQTPPLPKERNMARDELAFLQGLKFCRTHNTVLGPIVREYLLRGDIGAAVDECCRFAELHKHTPLQFELLSLLVRLSNAEPSAAQQYPVGVDEAQRLLGALTAAITQVHGVVNMNSGLLLAFAESGTDNQLRRLLINPEFRINEELLLKNCEYLGQEGAVQTLLRLGRGGRGLRHQAIDEHKIYCMLLEYFALANDHKSALTLFEQLEADDELKISQDFLRRLVQLLRVNNIEVPSNIALRAQII